MDVALVIIVESMAIIFVISCVMCVHKSEKDNNAKTEEVMKRHVKAIYIGTPDGPKLVWSKEQGTAYKLDDIVIDDKHYRVKVENGFLKCEEK